MLSHSKIETKLFKQLYHLSKYNRLMFFECNNSRYFVTTYDYRQKNSTSKCNKKYRKRIGSKYI